MANEPKIFERYGLPLSLSTSSLSSRRNNGKKKKKSSNNDSAASGAQTPTAASEQLPFSVSNITASSNQNFTEERATATLTIMPTALEDIPPPPSIQVTNAITSNSVGFVEDYIPFAPPDDDDNNNDAKDVIKLKSEKARGKEPARDTTVTTERDSNYERFRKRERSRDRGDWKKRKYDAIDDGDGYASKKQRMDAASRRAPWVYDIDWEDCKNVSEMLHKEVEAFTKWISPSTVEDEIRELTVAIISRAVTIAFPDAVVKPFGSYQTKLYLPSGDIDLVIVSDSMAYSNKVTVLHSLASVLRKAGITSNVTVISKAKVPIVKFVTSHGRFNVDISINQTNGIFGGQVINGFLRSMSGVGTALRSLVLITKLFLSQRSMNEVFTGGLGSYSIVCLAISFLQLHPKIRRGEIDPDNNLGVIVMEFFELYGCHFNFDEVGISIRDGGTYFSKRLRGWYDYGRKDCLSIEDPVDASNDISSGSFGFPKVRTSLAGAYSILTSTAYLRAATIRSKRRGQDFKLRKEFHPEDMSILSSVMGVTQETINHRRLVREVYDKRVLHNILGVKPKAQVIVQDQPAPAETRHDREPQKRPRSPPSAPRRERYSAWKNLGEDHAEVYHDKRGSSHRNDHDPEESGKYDIGKLPPRKRRRRDNQEDKHAVFVADDDDASGSEGGITDRTETNASTINGEAKLGKSLSSADTEKRRNYWLSKALALGDDISDSE